MTHESHTLPSRRAASVCRQAGKITLRNECHINKYEAHTALSQTDICHLADVTLITHPYKLFSPVNKDNGAALMDLQGEDWMKDSHV